jgi:carbon monoxide dehydrogenase subunit G
MKLEQSFTVAAPIDQVWAALVDVERVAPCLPGAQITERGEDGSYRGQFTVKLGPTTAAYTGTLKMEELDEGGRTAVMSARGTDRRGQGGASAMIRSTVTHEGDATRVEVVTDFAITGRLARFGRGGMIEDVSKRLLREFASCLQSTLDAGGPTAAAGEGSTATPAFPPAEAAPAGAPGAGDAAVAAAAAEAAAAGEPVAPRSVAEPPDLPGMSAATVAHLDPGAGGAPRPVPGPIPVPGPPGAGDAGVTAPPPLPPLAPPPNPPAGAAPPGPAPPPLPPLAPPPNPPAGGAPPGPAPPPHAAPTAGTAEGAPPAPPQPPSAQPQAKPLDAAELMRGVLKDRLRALWKRLGAFLRAGRRGSS